MTLIGGETPSASVGIAKLFAGQKELASRFCRQEKWVMAIVLLMLTEILGIASGMIICNINSHKGGVHIAKIETR